MVLDVDYNQSLYLPKVVLNTKMNANDQHSSAVRVRFGTRLTRKKMRSDVHTATECFICDFVQQLSCGFPVVAFCMKNVKHETRND